MPRKQREREMQAQLETLYTQYRGMLYWTARNMLGNQPDAICEAIEITLESMVRHMEKICSLPRDKQPAYLLVMAENACRSLIRKRARELLLSPEGWARIPSADGVEQDTLERVETEELRESILRLPERDQEMLRMRYFEEKSFSDIAERYHFSEGAARVAVKRSTERLRKILTEGDDLW